MIVLDILGRVSFLVARHVDVNACLIIDFSAKQKIVILINAHVKNSYQYKYTYRSSVQL